jgi:hypothetical protein
MNVKNDFFEEIPEADAIGTPRGRKPNAEAVLIAERFASLSKGKALAIPGLAVDSASGDAKTIKAKHGATIRSAAKLAGVSVSIAWGADGIPRVKIRK